MEYESRSDTGNNRGDWNHFNVTQTIPEQHTGSMKLRNYKKVHTGHCTHRTESANVKYTTYFTGEITLHVAQTVNTEQLQYYIP